MSKVSHIDRLPQRVRDEIDRLLVGNNFSDYISISAELRAQGYTGISKSGLHRYGTKLKRQVMRGKTQKRLVAAGVSPAIATEIAGSATLVLVIDRRNEKTQIFDLSMKAIDVIKLLEKVI